MPHVHWSILSHILSLEVNILFQSFMIKKLFYYRTGSTFKSAAEAEAKVFTLLAGSVKTSVSLYSTTIYKVLELMFNVLHILIYVHCTAEKCVIKHRNPAPRVLKVTPALGRFLPGNFILDIKVDQLSSATQNQAKNNPVGLLSSPIKI